MSLFSIFLNFSYCFFSYILQVFDNVTIMFNYMVGFGDVCSSAKPMDIVKIINSVFILFDQITDRYNVFKVSVH